MKVFFAAALAVATSACSPASRDNALEAEIRGMLKDPESAKFKPAFVNRPGLVCGAVNAKNSFGGYTGDMPYMQYQGHVLVASDEREAGTLITCCAHVDQAAKAGKSPWDQPGFTAACTPMPPTPWNFTVLLKG